MEAQFRPVGFRRSKREWVVLLTTCEGNNQGHQGCTRVHEGARQLLAQAGVNAESLRDFAEWLISCPEKRGRIDEDGGDQVRVGQADAETV